MALRVAPMRIVVLALALALCCTACVPIPVPIAAFSKSPFDDATLQALRAASRAEVRGVLGAPQASRSAGKYWFYAHSRESLGFIGSDAVFEDYEWLALGFDDHDRVNLVERNESMTGCLANGICHRGGLFGSDSRNAVLTAPASEDAAAKARVAAADGCAIYVYHEPLPLIRKVPGVPVSVDGRRHGPVDHSSYLLLTHPAGRLGIAAYQLRLDVDCKAGERLYVRIDKGMRGNWKTGKQISVVDAATGERAIGRRDLAMTD